jgi:nicotinamidase-related amidase
MSHCAVITVDLQYAAANRNDARRQAMTPYIGPVAAFLQKLRDKGIPVIHSQQVYDPTDTRRYKNDDIEYKKSFQGEGAKIIKEVWDDRDHISVKRRDSAFFETELDATLKVLAVDTIILTGVETQLCVQTSAADASFRGYNVIVPRDGVTSNRKEDLDRALEWLERYAARVMSIDEVHQAVERGELTAPERR